MTRATVNEGHVLIGVFPTGSAVTIDIVKLPENTLEISGEACQESIIPGVFFYRPLLSPIVYSQYAYRMSDGIDEAVGVFDLAGYPEFIDAKISSRTTLGIGGISWTYTLINSITGAPIADAEVWVTTDEIGQNVIAFHMSSVKASFK
jgi:hypothetical protein